MAIPRDSIVQDCTAIGYTDAAIENWALGGPKKIECVGIPGFPGTIVIHVWLVLYDLTCRTKNENPFGMSMEMFLTQEMGGGKLSVSWSMTKQLSGEAALPEKLQTASRKQKRFFRGS